MRARRAVLAQRLKQHAVEPELLRVAELRDADGHALVPGRGRVRAIVGREAVATGAV